MKKYILKIIPLFLSLSLLLNLCSCVYFISGPAENTSQFASDGNLTLRFLYVGQADSAFITLPDGKTMLVDAGDDADGERIANYIKSLGVSSIDIVVATHPHADHIGGLDKVLNKFSAGAIYTPVIPKSAEPDTTNYKQFIEATGKQNCGLSSITAGTVLYSADNIQITCLSPGEQDVYSDLNNYSLVIQMLYGNNRILLMGDAEKEAEIAMLKDYSDLRADLVKVGHHGSKSSSKSDFIKAVHPKYAVISCGIGNSNGFPHAKPLETLSSIDAQVFTTSEVGTVIAVSDGNSVTVTEHPEINLDGNVN